MHKAAAGDVSQRPSKWLELPETRKFLQSLSRRESVLKSDIIGSVMGRTGGTYAHWQIALAYSKWLSPELHMAVNSVYMRYRAADPNLASDTSPLSRLNTMKERSLKGFEPLFDCCDPLTV